MPKVIYKYNLDLIETQKLTMPYGASIIHVAQQPGNPRKVQLWAIVDPDPELTQCEGTVRIVHTGGNVPNLNLYEYVGTVLLINTEVYHVFVGEIQGRAPIVSKEIPRRTS